MSPADGKMEIRAVFLGAPGAGKGTQAKRMVERFGTFHLSSGDMLRDHCGRGTDLGARAKTFMDAGQLVPDDLIIEMVVGEIRRPGAAAAWILDGFPRTVPQAQSLDRSLAEDAGAGSGLSHVVYFRVPHEILVRRLTGRRTCSNCGAIWHLEFNPTAKDGICDVCGGALQQRADDHADVVEKRLEAYCSSTEPLLDYYRTAGVLVEVDADRAPDAVFEQLVERLNSSASLGDRSRSS